MAYTDAPATKMIYQFCLLCRRPLLDAVSVEIGMGPKCRSKAGIEVGEWTPNRERCNQLVYEATQAVLQKEFDKLTPIVEEFRILGFASLAQAVAERYFPISIIEETTDEGVVLILKAPFVGSQFGRFLHLGCKGVEWLKRRKRYSIPKAGRGVLWAALKRFHEGLPAFGPKGVFKIGE